MSGSESVSAAVELPDDHPGVHDEDYRRRRDVIASVGAAHEPGRPIPDVTYTAEEDEVWRTVSGELTELHRDLACAEYRRGAARLHLPTGRVPQLREVDAAVHGLTGFHIQPVPGLVPAADFYGALADRRFLSTQYIRHHSVPFYTPEPDLIHEIVGHGNMLGSGAFADLYQAAGRASQRVTTDEALEFFSKVFWFTLEFGVVHEEGPAGSSIRAYGAGLCSSYGEIQVFRDAEIRDWDLAAMGNLDYDITQYQPVLYAAPSMDFVFDVLTAFFDRFDDDTPRGIR
ncbi:MAG: phenylalanine 4-monooxygenase [Acidimicrobiales bacterium]